MRVIRSLSSPNSNIDGFFPIHVLSNTEEFYFPALLQMMINENMSDWAPDTVTINESVRAAKQFLDKELAKYDKWEALGAATQRSIDKFNFDRVKREGVGISMLSKFMGSNWKEWMIKEVLRNIKEEENLQAIEKIKNPGQAAGRFSAGFVEFLQSNHHPGHDP